MKKIFVFIIAAIMMVGCSQQKKETTFMITRDNTLYALYNQAGDKLTEYSYKTFQEVDDLGYIVTNEKDQKGFISLDGKEVIQPGTYETLEIVDHMFYATKKQEQKESKQDNKDEKSNKEVVTPINTMIKSNLYVLNAKGEVLYSADEKIGIIKSGLPIIQKENQYIVLYHEGEELYNETQVVKYAYQYNNSQSIILGFDNNETFYYYNDDEEKTFELTIAEKGTFQFLAQNEKGAILNDATLKSMIYVDFGLKKSYQNAIAIKTASYDDSGNIILQMDNKTFIYEPSKAPVLMTSYYQSALTYVVRSTDIYGPHHVYKDGQPKGDIENCQLYPEAKQVYYDIFPVYVRNVGYQYYNFDNKKVIDKTFLAAEAFDETGCAIVKTKEDGYSIIDEKGTVLTKKMYYQIKYIGSSYYAVYNEDGTFGVLDNEGNEVFEALYTTLPDDAIIKYDNEYYLVLGKNGRSFVYDIKDDMKEIFSHEGNIVFSEKGYFAIGTQYFTFEGEEIK